MPPVLGGAAAEDDDWAPPRTLPHITNWVRRLTFPRPLLHPAASM